MENNDSNELFLDIFDTEIVPGEEYCENEYGEAVHTDNIARYVLEEGILIKKSL